MKGTTWIALGLGGAGTIAGTGVAISNVYGNKPTKDLSPALSIKDHIAKEKGSNFQFISLVSDAQEALKSRYEKGSDNKPKNGETEVGKDQIVSWCEGAMNTKFSTETDPTYLSLRDWCFVDVTPLSQKAKDAGKEYVSDKEGNDDAWKSAWDTYNQGKTANTLRIEDSSLSNLNGDNRENGALDLYKWCKKTDDVKMYAANSEDTYQRYEKWCFKASPSR